MKSDSINLPSGQRIAFLGTRDIDANKPSVIALHGWQDNAASFHSMTELLRDVCNLWVMDLAGHGYSSPRSYDNFYYFHDYVDDLAQFIDKLQLSSLHLVGHSLGGLISTCYAAAFPAKVRSLFLIESLAPLFESENNVVQRLTKGIQSRRIWREKSVRAMQSRAQALQLRQRVTPLEESLLWPMIERGTQETEQGVFWRHDVRLKADSLFRLSEAQSRAIVKAIQCPVTAVLGLDGFEELKQQQRQAWFSHLQVHQVPGGHHCHLESPALVSQRLIEHIQRHEKAAHFSK
ncbi:alpha/beta fold hydrolase [Thaumasiovibrio subtropicus]|uniref:alpha/beta fold hydrolase n=1 Tax=Thaumasiovibrio subtropicus TaxID=1891207 RepID=UPI000B363506|nr:alpha/beta hydrolase [Thaumasiovibrio subtropicus]